jgi:hypothetical protein
VLLFLRFTFFSVNVLCVLNKFVCNVIRNGVFLIVFVAVVAVVVVLCLRRNFRVFRGAVHDVFLLVRRHEK